MESLTLNLVPFCGKVAMSTMPAELDEVFQGFFHEYRIIIVKWRLYKQLFGDSESIDLLNRHGAHGFGVIQDVIIKDVILCITRMMNTSKEAWGDPANLATLMIDLTAHKQTALAEKLRGMRNRIKPVADGLRQWRDAQISRNDYASFIGMKAGIDALPPPSRQMVEDVLSAVGEILKELQTHYTGLEELHKDVSRAGDFEELVSHLRDLEKRRANPSD
jgi:AbiU2